MKARGYYIRRRGYCTRLLYGYWQLYKEENTTVEKVTIFIQGEEASSVNVQGGYCTSRLVVC